MHAAMPPTFLTLVTFVKTVAMAGTAVLQGSTRDGPLQWGLYMRPRDASVAEGPTDMDTTRYGMYKLNAMSDQVPREAGKHVSLENQSMDQMILNHFAHYKVSEYNSQLIAPHELTEMLKRKVLKNGAELLLAERITFFLTSWELLTNDPEVLDTIHGMTFTFVECPSLNIPAPWITFSSETNAFIEPEVQGMLKRR